MFSISKTKRLLPEFFFVHMYLTSIHRHQLPIFFCYTFRGHLYRVSQNSRIPNSERGREGPSGGRKILRKKNHSS
jgi:hypothetical protein